MKDTIKSLRTRINDIGKQVRDLHHLDLDHEPADTAEIHANITLAYRHLEDARMRLGKAIQAYDGGVSCYDKPQTPEPAQAG